MKTLKKFSIKVSFLVLFILCMTSISYAVSIPTSDDSSTFSLINNALSDYLLEVIALTVVPAIYKIIKPAIAWFEEKTGFDIEIKLKERIRNFVNAAKNRLKKSASSGEWDEITFENEVYAEVMRMVTSNLPEYLSGKFSESWLKDIVMAVIEEENSKELKDKDKK